MLSTSRADPGFIAISRQHQPQPVGELAKLAESIGAVGASVVGQGRSQLATWGLPFGRSGRSIVFALACRARAGDSDVPIDSLVESCRSGGLDLNDYLPAFGVLRATDDGRIDVATDAIGARHIYHVRVDGGVAVSTSPSALARLGGCGLDRRAIAVQSLLGWQLGSRTLYAGVEKLGAGSTITATDGSAAVGRYADSGIPVPIEMDDAVTAATQMLRTYMNAYLDDHPDATLQLTGGQDSRLLLSAIPLERRRGLNVMTLGSVGSADVDIAAGLADRYGMNHHLITSVGLDELTAEEAFDRVVASARRLGCMADPLALTSLLHAESQIDQGPRVSGLGGEVARGFYYFGPPFSLPVSRRAASLLANWRMFANEPAERGALTSEFREHANTVAHDEVYRLLRSSGPDMRRASDEFYLFQRMQRWAGVTDSAVCFEREVVDPMLDPRFLDIARRLRPADKRNSRFLSRLQVSLDDELSRLPLDGRPPPRTFTSRTVRGTVAQGVTFGRKVARKGRQRLSGTSRPPVGGIVLGSKVVEHWRAHPEIMKSVDTGGIVDGAWVRDMLDGVIAPSPSTVAFLVNLVVAAEDLGPSESG